MADSTMLAWVGFAQIDFLLTSFAFVPIFALANKIAEAVLTGTAIEARVGGTFVDI